MIDPLLLDVERADFERDVATTFDSDVLNCISFVLSIWSKTLPPNGSLAARCAVMSEALDKLPRNKPRVRSTCP